MASDPTTQYAEDVVSGKEVAGPYVRASCQRHLDDLATGKDRGLWFDEAAAKRALDFFPGILRLNGGQFEGIPFHLHPSQAFIVGSLFGWKRGDYRRFRTAYIEQGKGNGKSPLAAGIGIYGLIADGEAGAQIYAAATKTDQARILFDDAVKMVKQSPRLVSALTMSGQNPVHTITHMKTSSFFKPISRESGKSGSGPRPHMALVDELHEHPDRSIVEMLERGFKSRLQPLMVIMTNSGSDRASYCYEMHAAAIQAAMRDHDPADIEAFDRLFSYVCALDEGDDPLALVGDNLAPPIDIWKKANPLLGTILSEDYLAGVCSDARAIAGKRNGILRLHFCVWTDAESAWISRQTWDTCVDPELSLDDMEGRDCWIGLDLGATKDMLGLGLVFPDENPDPDKREYAVFAHGFTPKQTLAARIKEDKAPYDVWVSEEYLTATPGPIVVPAFVVAWIADIATRFNVQGLIYDRYLFSKFDEYLDEAGLGLPKLEHPQGFSKRKDSNLWMPGSVDLFERLILEGRLRVAHNPALNSAVSGATFETSPAGLRRFTKQKAKRRIDLMIAVTMAIGGAAGGGGAASGRSYLEDDDLLVL